ncbi:OmpA family protein [Hyphomonas johnsonii]|uniref:OmpA family protein n=1 Tax=Hyphomonas johnsonii MHS-2 TaxID=1280950 RepID=A0A059FJF1_9PROT|nr:OmpA family protein [Hyphomonas johnsonii]KCZ90656.1 OmpA family protein [Hyphomonas johnsonii MHS-2]
MSDNAGGTIRRTTRRVRRTSRTDLPFVPFGLLPLGGLLFLLLFALVPFAQQIIEQSATRATRQAIDQNGAIWAHPMVSGQWVTLEGAPPSRLEGEQLLIAIRNARVPTWLGPARPVTRVNENFVWPREEVSDAPEPEWTFKLADGALSLTGQVPDAVTRDTLLQAAGMALDPPRLARIDDQLTVADVSGDVGYLNIALRGVNTVAKCDSGTASFLAGEFSLACDLPDAEAETVRRLVMAPLPVGRLGNVDILPDGAVASCESSLGQLLGDARIEFAPSSAKIAPASSNLLQRIAAAAAACPGTLRIEGHTDSLGNPNANDLLSEARAEAVRDALIARGVPADRLIAQGFGATAPVGNNATPEGRARNRRIEIRVIRASD